MTRRQLERHEAEAPRLYRPFDVRRTGAGKWRHIDNPLQRLKETQRRITTRVLDHVDLPETMTGGIRGRSALMNADFHVGRVSVVNLDLPDCFPRTTDREIFSVFKLHFGMSDEVAGTLTRLTTVGHRLPQGAPSSPMLANLAMLRMHEELVEYSRVHGLVLSQYVDDVTISGEDPVRHLHEFRRIARKYGKVFSMEKQTIRGRHEQQLVTGCLVNTRRGVTRAEVEKVRQEVFRLLALGDRVTTRELASVRGRIQHIRSVCPGQARSLLSLADELPIVGTSGVRAATTETRPCRGYGVHQKARSVAAFERSPGSLPVAAALDAPQEPIVDATSR